MISTRDQNTTQLNALFLAIINNDLKLVKALATRDNLTKENANGLTPIAEAAYRGKKEIFDYLFNTIILPHFNTHKNFNAIDQFQLNRVVLFLVYRDEFNRNLKYLENTLKIVFACGASRCNGIYRDTLRNALHIVAQKDTDFESIFELLLQHAHWNEVNQLDSKNKLPLNYAIDNKNIKFTKMLVAWQDNLLKKYLISFFILFKSQRLPLEILNLIAENILQLSNHTIDRLQRKIQQFPDYEYILKASCALDDYKNHYFIPISLNNSFLSQTKCRSQSSIKLFQNIENALGRDKTQEKVSGIKNSIKDFLLHSTHTCQAAISLSKFGFIPIPAKQHIKSLSELYKHMPQKLNQA